MKGTLRRRSASGRHHVDVKALVAPDSFGDSLTATEAAAAFAAGWGGRSALCPLSDGGPGFLEVLAASLGGERVSVATLDPLLRPVTGEILLVGDTAYVESAHSCGLGLVLPGERDPLTCSSAGVGRLVAAAVAMAPRRVVVGLGGSATNDGGAGALAQLGLALVDDKGDPIPPGARPLRRLQHLKPRAGAWPPRVALVGAVDVDNPLLGPGGASSVFAPQKGASPAVVGELEAALGRLAAVAGRDVEGAVGLESSPGAGAAGGLGYGLLLMGGELTSGSELVLEAVGFDELLADVDLVVTGEGSLDAQSLRGKVVSAVTSHAAAAGVPCVAVAGKVSLSRDELRRAGLSGALSLSTRAGSMAASLEDPSLYLREAAGALWDLVMREGTSSLARFSG